MRSIVGLAVMMLAFQAGDPGSTPGRCIFVFLFFILILFGGTRMIISGGAFPWHRSIIT